MPKAYNPPLQQAKRAVRPSKLSRNGSNRSISRLSEKEKALISKAKSLLSSLEPTVSSAPNKENATALFAKLMAKLDTATSTVIVAHTYLNVAILLHNQKINLQASRLLRDAAILYGRHKLPNYVEKATGIRAKCLISEGRQYYPSDPSKALQPLTDAIECLQALESKGDTSLLLGSAYLWRGLSKHEMLSSASSSSSLSGEAREDFKVNDRQAEEIEIQTEMVQDLSKGVKSCLRASGENLRSVAKPLSMASGVFRALRRHDLRILALEAYRKSHPLTPETLPLHALCLFSVAHVHTRACRSKEGDKFAKAGRKILGKLCGTGDTGGLPHPVLVAARVLNATLLSDAGQPEAGVREAENIATSLGGGMGEEMGNKLTPAHALGLVGAYREKARGLCLSVASVGSTTSDGAALARAAHAARKSTKLIEALASRLGTAKAGAVSPLDSLCDLVHAVGVCGRAWEMVGDAPRAKHYLLRATELAREGGAHGLVSGLRVRRAGIMRRMGKTQEARRLVHKLKHTLEQGSEGEGKEGGDTWADRTNVRFEAMIEEALLDLETGDTENASKVVMQALGTCNPDTLVYARLQAIMYSISKDSAITPENINTIPHTSPTPMESPLIFSRLLLSLQKPQPALAASALLGLPSSHLAAHDCLQSHPNHREATIRVVRSFLGGRGGLVEDMERLRVGGGTGEVLGSVISHVSEGVLARQHMLIENMHTAEAEEIIKFVSLEQETKRLETLRRTLLPKSWTVCSIAKCPRTSGILVTRLSGGTSPVAAPLALNVQITSGDSPEITQVLSEIRTILSNSDKLNDSARRAGRRAMGRTQKREWWTRKRELDDGLKELACSLAGRVLGPAKGMLLGRVIDKKLQERIDAEAISVSRNPVVATLGLTPPMCFLLISTPPPFSPQLVKELVQASLEDEGSDKDVRSALKSILEARGRIWDEGQNSKENRPTDLKREAVILIVGRDLEGLPWESTFELNVSGVSRVPNLHFLYRLLQKQCQRKGVFETKDWSQGHYIVDPEGDLTTTRESFQEKFRTEKGWKGSVGVAPSRDEIRAAIEKSDMFVYCGHSNGSKFLPGWEIRGASGRCTALLMGCSSGELRNYGEYEPQGVILDYLIAGCPAVVANLWDVTDKDIDRLTSNLLEALHDGEPLASAVAAARSSCKLPYLNGVAPVCYGLPNIRFQSGKKDSINNHAQTSKSTITGPQTQPVIAGKTRRRGRRVIVREDSGVELARAKGSAETKRRGDEKTKKGLREVKSVDAKGCEGKRCTAKTHGKGLSRGTSRTARRVKSSKSSKSLSRSKVGAKTDSREVSTSGRVKGKRVRRSTRRR
ncbi:hypothetical protein AAMO2058_001441700 [Amorphochlora amoebiformis]